MLRYREDWHEDDWKAITINPANVVRKQLEKEGLSDGIQAIWGKSLRQHRSPATPHQALTVQVHLTVEDAKLDKLLTRSGFNKLFLTPKTQVGRLNPNIKVIWIPGDVPKVTVPPNVSLVLGWYVDDKEKVMASDSIWINMMKHGRS